MTKTNIRRIILSLLVIASFVSFIFINTVTVSPTPINQPGFTEEIVEEEETTNPSELTLPDVEMVKQIIKQSKRILHVFVVS